MVKIFLDAGHGGKDPGAVGNGISEKNIVLDIVLRIEAMLKNNYEGIEVMCARKSDVYLTLTERTNMANKWGADAYLSVHNNSASNTTARGFETFIYPTNDSKTNAYQNVLHNEIIAKIRNDNVSDRGKRQSDFHVLRETRMIALLSENLFISNPTDAALLKNDSFRQKLAEGHVIGLERFLGLKPKASPTPPPLPPKQSNVLFQVITGTFSNRENAERHVQNLKKSGYESYIIEKK